MIRRRGVILFSCLLLAGALLTACGGGDDGVETSVRDTATTTTVPDSGATTRPDGTTTTATIAPATPGTTLQVTFVRGEKVGTAHRRVAPTSAVGRAALEQLLAGPTAGEQAAGLATAIPKGTKLLGLDIAGGTATVDLSGEFVSGGGSLSVRERLAQVVFTLTQFPTVDGVTFRIDGKATTVFTGDGVTIPSPAGRDEFRDVTPLIFVESVAPGDAIKTPVKVAGMSNTFEANVRIRILGGDGSVLADTFTTATSGTGTWGTFAANVPFAKGAHATGTVVVFETSPKDGSMVNVVEVPVEFAQ